MDPPNWRWCSFWLLFQARKRLGANAFRAIHLGSNLKESQEMEPTGGWLSDAKVPESVLRKAPLKEDSGKMRGGSNQWVSTNGSNLACRITPKIKPLWHHNGVHVTGWTMEPKSVRFHMRVAPNYRATGGSRFHFYKVPFWYICLSHGHIVLCFPFLGFHISQLVRACQQVAKIGVGVNFPCGFFSHLSALANKVQTVYLPLKLLKNQNKFQAHGSPRLSFVLARPTLAKETHVGLLNPSSQCPSCAFAWCLQNHSHATLP